MPKDTPIVINNFNRVTTTKKMVEDLWRLGYTNLHILDNTSTYPPLLEWYETVKDKLNIRYLPHNMMQNAIFDCGILSDFHGKADWIAYTDSDLTLNPNLPEDFVDQLIALAIKWGFKKAGMALQIDNLPDNEWGDKNRAWELEFWNYKLEENVYKGQIDTTFSVWNPSSGIIYSALRVAGNFTARHEPWYTDFGNLNEEERYYLEHSHSYSTYKRFYDNYINK